MDSEAVTPPYIEASTDKDDTDETKKVSFGIISLVIFLLVLGVIICARRCQRKKSHNRHSSAASSHSSQSGKSHDLKQVKVEGLSTGLLSGKELGQNVKALLKGYIIDSQRLILDKVIGKGQFGCVYEGALAKDSRCSNDYGQLTHEKVAVKTLRCTGGSNLDPDTVEAFLREGMIMKDFSHPNVLTLLGVTLGESGIPMIILPYMANGNLKKYISNPARVLLVRDLLEYGRQVARGMKYLAEQKFVHRDLAARNCMLDSEGTVKVADFGLSRDIYTRDYYCSEDKQVKLPVKWMALESLSTSKYSSKTDVWSFGVLLWELLTRGATPYPDVSNWDVWRYIKAGRRMRQPDSCPDEVYDLMKRCWRESAERRPTFQAIVVELDAMMAHDEEEGLDDVDGSPDYMNLYQSVEAPDEIDQENTGPM